MDIGLNPVQDRDEHDQTDDDDPPDGSCSNELALQGFHIEYPEGHRKER